MNIADILFIAAFLFGWLVAYAVGKLYRMQANRGRVWLVRLNSNNKTGFVSRIKPKSEGYQIKNGPYVKFEGSFAYIDRNENRPLFVANEDTGLLIRAKEGETEELDGSVLATFMGNKAIERINLSTQGTNWAIIACVLAGAAVVGLVVVGFMVKGLAHGAGH